MLWKFNGIEISADKQRELTEKFNQFRSKSTKPEETEEIPEPEEEVRGNLKDTPEEIFLVLPLQSVL